jgi:hypothetical protein
LKLPIIFTDKNSKAEGVGKLTLYFTKEKVSLDKKATPPPLLPPGRGFAKSLAFRSSALEKSRKDDVKTSILPAIEGGCQVSVKNIKSRFSSENNCVTRGTFLFTERMFHIPALQQEALLFNCEEIIGSQ